MRNLYSSQVRRWCVQKDDHLYVYENEAALDPVKVIPLFKAKVVDTSDIEACVYRFRIDFDETNCAIFQALTRTDLEKWTTVISVKIAVLQDRSERHLRRSASLSSERTVDTAGELVKNNLDKFVFNKPLYFFHCHCSLLKGYVVNTIVCCH